MTAAGASSWRTRTGARREAAAEADRLRHSDGVAASRRWPWALLAAVLGAAGGAGAAVLVRRRLGADLPGAQEPHELRAVVDRPVQDPPR